MRTTAKVVIAFLAFVGLAATLAVAGFLSSGISARSAPVPSEAGLARRARHLLVPAPARRLINPLPVSPEILDSARAHWADHCASCHGNDGKGQTSMGRNLSPRVPDMTAAGTQHLSDGELFWIIENGVRLTGMPAWGTEAPEDDAESWELVHFVRHLPQLTAADLTEMERLNPVSRAELEEELERERFLSGEDSAPPPLDRHP